MEHRSAGISGSAEMVPGSRRREANSPDAACLCGTWKPQWGLPGDHYKVGATLRVEQVPPRSSYPNTIDKTCPGGHRLTRASALEGAGGRHAWSTSFAAA